jgi:hypothetical protein
LNLKVAIPIQDDDPKIMQIIVNGNCIKTKKFPEPPKLRISSSATTSLAGRPNKLVELKSNIISNRCLAAQRDSNPDYEAEDFEKKEEMCLEADPWNSKSISYMLDIWQHAEGINLESIISIIKDKVHFTDVIPEDESDKLMMKCMSVPKKTMLRPGSFIELQGVEELDLFGFDKHLYAGRSRDDIMKSAETHTFHGKRKEKRNDNIRPHANKMTMEKNMLLREQEKKKNVAGRIISACENDNGKSAEMEPCSINRRINAVYDTNDLPIIKEKREEAVLKEVSDVLSSDTFSLLKRLSRETEQQTETSHQHFFQNDAERVRTAIVNEQELNVPILDLFRSETLAGIEIKRNKVEKPSVFKKMNLPGTMNKIIDYLLEEKDGDRLDLKKLNNSVPHQGFKLKLPEENATTQKEDAEFRPPSLVCIYPDTGLQDDLDLDSIAPKNAREATMFVIDTLKLLFGKDLIVSPSYKSAPTNSLLFRPIKLESHESNQSEKDETHKTRRQMFSLRRFVTLIKVNLRELPQYDFIEDSGSDWIKFIESDTSRITNCPNVGDVERENLYNVFCRYYTKLIISRALHQQVVRELRYEACKLLIESETYNKLGRWNTLQFKITLPEVLEKGSDDQMDVIAQYFANIGQVDARIIAQFRAGLGNIETAKREASLKFYSNLGTGYADMVIPMLIGLGGDMNYKVRYDAALILSQWILR